MKSINTIVVYRSMKSKRNFFGKTLNGWGLQVITDLRTGTLTNERSQGQKETALERSYCLFNIDHIDLL